MASKIDKKKHTFLIFKLFNSSLLFFLSFLLNGFQLEILVVNLSDFFDILNFFFSSLSFFLLLFAYGLLGLQPDELSFFKLLAHFLNVFLFDFLVLFSNSLFELFELLFFEFLFLLFLFLFFLDLFLSLMRKLPRFLRDNIVLAFFKCPQGIF